jgi:uncharacterized repeat protein (TIGR02059 family)
MRNLLIIIFLTITVSLSGATYYVATNGNDSNVGSIDSPWLTLQKAFNSISPGDILYIRGGTYSPTGTVSGGGVSGVVVNGKKGTASSMYNVFAYPGEHPILDCRNITNSSYNRYGIFIVSSDYWYIKGIEITRADQPSGHVGQGVMVMSSNNNKLEAIVSHHNGGPGMGIRDQSEGNLFLNCDSYNNYDPLTATPGDDADGYDVGFITARSGNDRVNTLQGCRAWLNGDDGFDMYQYPGYHGIYILKDCWSWKNGYKPDGTSQAGDGNGFKYGADNNYSLDAVVRRTSTNCIAYSNRQRGFSQEAANVKEIFYNNTAYLNGTWGFSFYNYDTPDILRNNVSYKNPNGTIENQGTKRVHDHNSWDSNVTLSDADFVSLDGTQLSVARKSDGSLPDITFLHLATGSDLIDAGVNVGLPYTGNAPDMGAFEVQGTSTSTNPVFRSASVENSAPSALVMNYDQSLNSLIIPDPSAFTVTVNSTSRSISSVTISGTTVLLNLASPAVYGDAIVVSYTKPATNPLQNSTGLQADNLAATNVINNVTAPVPVYVSSVIENAAPSLLVMTYSVTLANVVPSTSSFTVLVNSTRRSVSTVTISGAKVQLTLSSPVAGGDVVTVAYTKPSTNPIQSASGGQAASLGAKSVTNNVVSVTPVYVSSVIENATPSVLTMTYNMTLANIVPATSAFSVLINSSAVSVNSVAVSGTSAILTLARAAVSGDVITVSYTKPTRNPLQSASGSQAASISNKSVTNNVISTAPVFVSAAIEDATPRVITLTYSMSLANIVPATTAFSVLVNSSSAAVSSVAVSGTSVNLTLASAVVTGDVITVSYTKPTKNPLQSSSGSQAASISNKSVTNNVLSAAPVFVSAVVENATSKVVDMTYSQSLANIVPSVSAFTVTVNSSKRTIGSVSVSGTKVSLTLSTAVAYGDVIRVSYTKPSANPLQNASGALVASLSLTVVTNNVLSIIPSYVSSIVANATPKVVEMTYSLPLANVVPSTSAFTVMVNSAKRTVSSVAISGNTVLLTLSSAIVYGDVITVSYTKPSSNPLQSTAGGRAASISTKSVTNNVLTSAPVYVSSVIQNATPNILEITYSGTLANVVPAASSFSVVVSASSRSVTSVTISGTNVLLTLSSNVAAGNTVTVAYTRPSTNPLQSETGALASSITAQPVTNNIANQANNPPTISITAPADNSTFTTPASITISADANDTDGSITLVEFFNGTESLGSTTAAPYSITRDLSTIGNYTISAVATDNLGAKTTSAAINIIVNDVSQPVENIPPVVSISSPTKGYMFSSPADIEIEAMASDDDGSVSKVELYVGKEKLAELTAEPYIYVWKGVTDGTYQIRAVAIDNLGATDTSAFVEFTVGNKPVYDGNSDIINLYPNPSDGHFSIEFLVPLQSTRSEIIISDMSGNQVQREPVTPEETVKQIELLNARTGLYILTVVSDQILVTKKIIIR